MIKSSGKLQKVVILLVTWGLLLAFFIAYQMFFVRSQEEFLRENGFRSLASLSKGVIAKFAKARVSTESFLRLVNEDKDKETLRAYLKLYLGDPNISDSSLDELKECRVPTPESKKPIPLELTLRGSRLMLSISCFKEPADKTADLTTTIQLFTVDVKSWIDSAFQEQINDFDDVLVINSSGQVLFEQSKRGTRIVDINSLKPEEEKGGSGDESDKRKTNDNKNREEVPTSTEDAKPRRLQSEWLARQSGASSITEITYAGKRYKLFSQPLRIWLPTALGKGQLKGKVEDLTVCALWDAKRFGEESRKIPYSTLIWAALTVVVLLSLSWPLFKLRYMGGTERFNATDGWYLILAIFLASTSVMFMVLNASYVAHARDDVDQKMETLAREIEQHFEREVECASQQLAEFQDPARLKDLAEKSQDDEVSKKSQGDDLPSVLVPNYLARAEAARRPYSFFDTVSWIDAKGLQVGKLDVRKAASPLVRVNTRNYFKSVMSDASWPPKSRPNYLEPILSTNTDEFSTMLSAPFLFEKDKEKGVVAMSFRPLSLVDPVLPPGYRFAVIDSDCNVLFHSDSFRNMRENFCDESKDPGEFRPWLFGGVNTPLDISYGGHPARAYLTSFCAPSWRPATAGASASPPRFAGGQPFLLVFREPGVDLTLNLAVVLVCSFLMAVYFILLVMIAAIFLLLRGTLHLVYAPKFFWPQRKNAISYLQLFSANMLLLVLFWVLCPRLYEAPLLGLSLGVALVSVLLAIFKLTCPRWGPLVFSVLLICVTLAAWLTFIYLGESSLDEWWRALVWFGVASLMAALLAESISSSVTAVCTSAVAACVNRVKSWIERVVPKPISSWTTRVSEDLSTPEGVTRSAQKHFILAYVLVVLSLITAAGLVPCVGSFKYAHNIVSELSLKHDLIVLSERVSARRTRIRQHYEETVKNRSVGHTRFANTWDRYYAIVSDGTKSTGNDAYVTESDFEVQDNQDLTVESSVPSGGDGNSASFNGTKPAGINAVLKSWIAQATLNIPADPLGSEMSRLGIASRNNPYWTWKHVTGSTSPAFELNWKPGSRSPDLIVKSMYREWERLRWRDCIWVPVLWVVVSFWLMIVVKKIFFTGIEDTHLNPVDWRGVEDIKKNCLVIERAKSGRSQWLSAITNLSPDSRLDMRVELKKMLAVKSYQPNCQGQVAILDYFDFNMKDRRYNDVRLDLLEKLLLGSARKLVLVSTVDPLFFLSDSGPKVLTKSKDPALAQRLLDRWAVLLSQFTKVRSKDSGDRQFHEALQTFDRAHKTNNDRHRFANWVTEECGSTTYLRTIGKELLSEFQEGSCPTREWVVGRVLDLTDSYYRVLWAGLTLSERTVLYQLALDGWANPKNIKAMQQLERKLLISRKPMFRIMNESFGRFVRSTDHSEEIAEWEKREQQSTWHAFRFVAGAVAVAGGAWLFYTQAAYSQAVVGYVAAIGTLLATLGNLFGRSGRPVTTKAE